MVAMLIGCGLRRAELLAPSLESIQRREEHWVIADLVDGVVAVSDAGVDAGAAAEKMVQQFPSVALADDGLIVR
jgi:hypothetical protein